MSRYAVTDRAGSRVAGRRAKPGDVLELTPAEAAYELQQGTLVPEGQTLSQAWSEDSAQLRDLRTRARGGEPSSSEEAAQAPPAGAPRKARKASSGT